MVRLVGAPAGHLPMIERRGDGRPLSTVVTG
jgi:hypothetical protein